jgi:TonB family protein
MRRMILTSLVLLPVLAHAQASTSTEPQPSISSANLLAELTVPAAPAAPGASASIASINTANHAMIREFVQTQMMDNFTDAALRLGGTLEFSMKGSLPTQSSAPRLTTAVEIGLSPQELSEQPAVSRVVVRAIIDQYGIPRNVAITQSAGPVVDQKAIAAVSQYRFKPAMVDNQPTWATVSISIKIQKP